MIDVAIIGSGPAGLSAAINVYARNKKAVVFGRSITTSWLYKAESVNNHLGMPNMSGKEMMEAFLKHAMEVNIDIREGRALQVLSMGDHFMINFENEFIEAKKVIIATGLPKSKGIPGEEEFLGKGTSYCATCDGMLYQGRDVAVVGESQEAEEDANFLADLCNVTYIPAYALPENHSLKKNIKTLQAKPLKIMGEQFVSGLETDKGNLPVTGVFLIKESVKPNALVYGLKMDGSAIAVNRKMETNLKGLYAAGDCTGTPYQLSKAIGEGLIAGLEAAKES